ncbi:CHAT domain-containing protein [Nodosilinea sp. PGN35]|uniref:CHAT domain-containing protein n=1 Tax=Nodosilinea sp. PGN35 TaxID=3020489 RepID=UPI0023B20E6E|nr:CHAT domain-containing protein [Nodosilinea sp. TSF1-S3]MDF0366614.1 CHAT domain-containing protein [Nodosilinea sp. TSF1-S3]
MNKIKVLFLAANPFKDLNLDVEVRSITEKIRASEYRDHLQLIPALAVRPDDLLQLLNEHKPHIVHFSGHGSELGEIVLADNNGAPKVVSIKAMKALMTTLKDNIQLVILNACYTKEHATAITEVINCAIGMNAAIEDPAAIVFAASFYRAVGFARSVQEAFDQGLAALALEGFMDNSTPEFFIKDGVDPSEVFF